MLNQPILCQSLLGRSAYLADLDRLLDAAAQGQRQLVLLSGEAGIGKSRLTAEISKRAAARTFVTLVGQCFPSDRTIPYAPILDLLRTRYTHKGTTEQKENSALQKLGQLLPGIAPLSPIPGAPLSLEPEAHKQQLITMLLSFIAEFTAQGPLLLIFEDLHWSDEASLDFLRYLTRWSATQPLFLLLTYRTDEENTALQRWLAQIDRERFTVELRLAPLSREDVVAMTQQMLGQPVPIDIQDAVYALAEGNPFFVEEILKALIASGGIILVDGAWRYVSRQVALHVPRSIQEMIQQRIALLSRGSQPVLKIASVVGRRFTFTLLQTLTGLDEAALLGIVKELIAGQFVVQESADEFVFRHALTREVVYQELLVRERRHLHRTVAETLEHLSKETPTPYLTEMAYHFYAAEVWDKASKYAQLAGEEAQALYAPYAAIEQWSRVIDANQHLKRPPSSYIYWSRGRAYEITGAFELARADFEQALSLAQAGHDVSAEWQSLIALGFLWTGRDYTQAGQLYQQAIELARRTQEPRLLARSLNYFGNWYSNIEQPHEALRAHQQALTIFQQADQEADLAATYDLMGMTAMLGGDLLQATEYYQQAIPYLQKLNDQQGLTSSLATLMLLGEGGSSETETLVSAQTSSPTSLSYGERALRIAHEIGHRPAEAYALIALAQYLGPHGEYARAFEMIQAGLALAEQIDHHEWCTAAAHWQLGVLYLDLLDLSQAKQHLEHALGIARRIGSRNWMRITVASLARLLLLEGTHSKAETLLNEVLATDAPTQSNCSGVMKEEGRLTSPTKGG